MKLRNYLIPVGVSVTLIVGLAGCSTPPAKPTSTPTPNAGAAGCLVSDQQCLGALKPGKYSSVLFDPDATGKPGQLTYTTPEGWANAGDFTFQYMLQPSAAYLANDQDHWGIIGVLADPGVAQPAGACDPMSIPNSPTDGASIEASLDGIPGLTVTKLPSETISGKPATVFETSVDTAAVSPKACRAGTVPIIASTTDGQPWAFQTSESESLRVYVVDLDKDHSVAIYINGPKADFAQLTEAAKPLIASFALTS